jgi:hypothetical protein
MEQYNPYSQFRQVYTLEQILAAPKVFDLLTKLQCCPTSDGAGAVIVCSEQFVHRHHLEEQAIEILGDFAINSKVLHLKKGLFVCVSVCIRDGNGHGYREELPEEHD